MDFNDRMQIKSSFFIGVNNGIGLSYPLNYAKKWIPIIKQRGFEIGVHGINFQSVETIKCEYDLFRNIVGSNNFGIRMHYLRSNETTFQNIEKVGYLYDATEQGFNNPYKIGNMWEFPLQIMDGWIINGDNRYQTRTLEEAKTATLIEIDKAKKANLDYISILFHDRYMSKSFETWKSWYAWLIQYLKQEGYEFVVYEQAIKELENK